jgi:hypothetical protein
MRKKKTDSLSKLQKELDRLFSLWVRQSNAVNGVVSCCTCGKIMPWRASQCGHFMSRRYNSTRFDDKNVAPQCSSDNMFNQGRQFEFGLYIDKKYGVGTAEALSVKSKMLCKRTKFDYEYLIKEIKDKLLENGFEVR